MNASAMRALASPNGPQGITCSDCGCLVKLVDLATHVCGSPPPSTPGLRGRLEGLVKGASAPDASGPSARRAKKPTHIDIDARGYSSRRVPPVDGGLSPSPSSGSLSPSPSALSPSFMSQSTSASSGLSGLSRSSSATSDSSLHSPLNSPSLQAKLPFFNKYERVYGEASPSLSRSPAQQDVAAFAAAPRIALTHERTGSSSTTSSSSSRRRQPEDTRLDKYRVAGFYDTKPAIASDLSKSRSDAGYAGRSREPGLQAAPVHGKTRSDAGGGDGLQRADSGREALGRRFMAGSPNITPSNSFKDSLSRLANERSSPSPTRRAPGSSVDALDDLLNDMRFDEPEDHETPTPPAVDQLATDARPPSLDAYYFDDDPGMTSDDEVAVTPRASAAAPAPRSDIGSVRARAHPFARAPSPARTAPVGRSKLSSPPAVCQTCRTSVSPTQAVERDGARLCGSCYAERYLPKCRKCKLAIEGRAIGSGDGKVKGKFHAECFNCFTCSAPFPDKEFYVWDSRPMCANCWHRMAGTICANCDLGIEGPCVSLGEEGGRKYHPSCFTCSHKSCTILLSEYHYVAAGLPYCERHAERRTTADRRAEKRRTVIKNVRRP